MPRCIILTPLYAGEELPWIAPQPGDFLICADGGWARARQFGLTPQLVVGDFDSMPPAMRPDVPTLTLPQNCASDCCWSTMLSPKMPGRTTFACIVRAVPSAASVRRIRFIVNGFYRVRR